MSSCIRFNKFNKYFKYILLTTLFRYFNICLLGYNHNGTFEKVSLINFLYDLFNTHSKIDLSNFRMTELLFNFIGISIFSFFTRLYELYISGKHIKYFFQINDPFFVAQVEISRKYRDSFPDDFETIQTKNCLYKFKNCIINNTSIWIYILIFFVWVIQEILTILFSDFLKDIDYWFFEILIVTIIFSKIFLKQIYTHQKLAIIINLIPCIFKTATIILRFESDEPTIYTKYPWLIPAGIIFYLLLIAINAFINCSIKSFLDLKYISTSQLLMFYGLVGTVICIMTCIINTHVPCSDNNNPSFINKNMCQVYFKNKLYFDNLEFYFSSLNEEDFLVKVIRIIIIITDSITFFLKQFFYILVIKYTDPVHITFAVPIYYIIKKIVLPSNNLIRDNTFFLYTSNFKPARYVLDMSGDVVCFIGFLIYLEIIELNIYGLNYNLRKNIIKRGKENDLFIFDFTEILTEDDEDESNKSYTTENNELSEI